MSLANRQVATSWLLRWRMKLAASCEGDEQRETCAMT